MRAPDGAHLPGHLIVPGFVDVHVHGVRGIDSLDGGDAVAKLAARPARIRRDRLLPDVGRVSAERSLVRCWPASAPRDISGTNAARVLRRISKAISSARRSRVRSRNAVSALHTNTWTVISRP